MTNKIFDLGSKYQLELITKGQALEVAQSLADELTSTLDLDHPIEPLAFLAESNATLTVSEDQLSEEVQESVEPDANKD